ncbi:MAG: hypothetical protein D9V45_11185 [Chloroflexi bacterium]|nr:MAG: hypothetical protein D9V45_11185 [Chloroflexota bacterium]
MHESHIKKLGGQLCLIILALAVLAGCTATPQETSLPPAEASPTTKVIAPSLIPTQETTATPYITLIPQYTPTPRLITPAPPEGTFTDQSVVSPDGNWTALPDFETLPDGYRVSLRVFNKDKSVVWTPMDYKGDGLGYVFPMAKRWSADSRYFYYVESIASDGCSEIFPTDQRWLQLDTQTGKVETIEMATGRGHAFSPDEKIQAYTTVSGPLALVLLDIQTKIEQKVVLLPEVPDSENAQGGNIIWSPDGESLILAISSANICDNPEVTFYLMIVQLADSKVKLLYQGEDYVRALQWSPDGKVLVMDWNSRSWWMDAETGKITTAPLK